MRFFVINNSSKYFRFTDFQLFPCVSTYFTCSSITRSIINIFIFIYTCDTSIITCTSIFIFIYTWSISTTTSINIFIFIYIRNTSTSTSIRTTTSIFIFVCTCSTSTITSTNTSTFAISLITNLEYIVSYFHSIHTMIWPFCIVSILNFTPWLYSRDIEAVKYGVVDRISSGG